MKTGRQILEEIVGAVAGKNDVITHVEIENARTQLKDRTITYIWKTKGVVVGQKIEHKFEELFLDYLTAQGMDPLNGQFDGNSSTPNLCWEAQAGIRIGGKVETDTASHGIVTSYSGLDGFDKEYVEKNSLFAASDIARNLPQIFKEFNFKQRFAEKSEKGLGINDVLVAKVTGSGDKYCSFVGYHREQIYDWGFFLVPRTPVELFCEAAEQAFNKTVEIPLVTYFIETPILRLTFPLASTQLFPMPNYNSFSAYMYEFLTPKNQFSKNNTLKEKIEDARELFEHACVLNQVLSSHEGLFELIEFYKTHQSEIFKKTKNLWDQEVEESKKAGTRIRPTNKATTYRHNLLLHT